ncbi:ABC-type nitrate/sulfonate/bicarbonate transport system, permease component [Natronincola peptidivorans]|uniref:ABC-type nitrate/sulfonate/bicarbonate transport system, permease component n=1 Tax=Natronincola peptidivorans TaxID=426128 RepID=A0A1I0A708_9FIRM|nr:ABC transporter permease [Natronincola peptidivorans]SES89914.1 ABC-type nitrate/sulfonate/bicarbonate transport system, permease component [Natronincola peptidivorans]
MKKLKSIGSVLSGFSKGNIDFLPVGFIVVLILLWEGVARLALVPPFILPAPSKVLHTLVTTLPLMEQHITATMFEAVVGFSIAILAGILLAIMMDSMKIIKRVFYPLLITSQTVPIIILAPLFAMWFGFGYLPKIVIVVLVCFFPITLSLLEGLESVDKDLLNLLKSMGASRWDIYRMVKLPAALPSFFSGLKISGTYSIMAAVIGEWVGGKRGLGVYMLRVRQSFAIDRVFATIVVIVLLSIGVLKLIGYIEKKAMPWNKEI